MSVICALKVINSTSYQLQKRIVEQLTGRGQAVKLWAASRGIELSSREVALKTIQV